MFWSNPMLWFETVHINRKRKLMWKKKSLKFDRWDEYVHNSWRDDCRFESHWAQMYRPCKSAYIMYVGMCLLCLHVYKYVSCVYLAMCKSPLHSLSSVWTGGTVAAGISGSALPVQAAGHTYVPPDGEREKKELENNRMKGNWSKTIPRSDHKAYVLMCSEERSDPSKRLSASLAHSLLPLTAAEHLAHCGPPSP